MKSKRSLKDLYLTLSTTDKFMILFLIINVISYLSSNYKHMALWGGADKWRLGLLTQTVFVNSYFLISRLWKKRISFIFLFLPVTVTVFALGFLNRFGIYPLQMAGAGPQFISTIGNINWYCGYMVTIFFGGIYIGWSEIITVKWQKVILYCYISIGFASLVTQGSSSGILALTAVLYVLFVVSVKDSKKMLSYLNILLILSAVCLCILGIRVVFPDAITYREKLTDILTFSILPIIMAAAVLLLFLFVNYKNKKGQYPLVFFNILAKSVTISMIIIGIGYFALLISNSINPGSIGPLSDMDIFQFSPDWGSKRGATWKAGIMCFSEQNIWRKFVGVGPDSMSAFLYDKGSPALKSLVTSAFPNLSLTNAHNEWITILVNLGIGGLVSFIGITVSNVKRCFLPETALKNINGVIAGACGLCVLSYIINNIFSFQQIMSGSTLFIVIGLGEAYHRTYLLSQKPSKSVRR